MIRLATSFVLGYHGCDAEVARQAVLGDAGLMPSSNRYDWLGSGTYFWEADPERAWEWALERSADGRSSVRAPGVVGAVIDLGHCLDLTARPNLEYLRVAHRSMVIALSEDGLAIPQNAPAGDRRVADVHLRRLDNAVVNFLHSTFDDTPNRFDTVRAPFIEGEPIYEGAKFHEKTHIQIAVRTPGHIKGYFYPPGYTPAALARR